MPIKPPPRRLAEAPLCIVELCEALNVKNIKDLPGPWFYSWEDGTTKWAIAANGKRTVCRVDPPNLMGCDLHPHHFAVWRNGWLFALMTPFGGEIMNLDHEPGSGEDAFIAAIKRHTERVKTQSVTKSSNASILP